MRKTEKHRDVSKKERDANEFLLTVLQTFYATPPAHLWFFTLTARLAVTICRFRDPVLP